MTIADCDPQISFEKEVYFPGDEVKGRAWVSTTKNLKATSVEITFSGKIITAHNGKFVFFLTKKIPGIEKKLGLPEKSSRTRSARRERRPMWR